MKALQDLNAVVLRVVNGLSVGETKVEAVQSITSFVEEQYISKAMIQDLGCLSVEDAEKLHQMGFEFKIRRGKVAGLVLRQGGVA